MTLILWGSIISIAGALIGGVIVAIGKYRQDTASSMKTDTILFKTEEGVGIGKITKEGVEELIAQKNKLDAQVKDLLSKQSDLIAGQDTLNDRLEPFIDYAKKMFPNVDTDQALYRLQNLLEEQSKKLEQTDNKVGEIQKDLTNEKAKTIPELTLKGWTTKNQKVNSVPKLPFRSKESFNVKEKFNLDYVIFNQIEFNYKTEINRSEFTFVLNKNDVVYCLLNINGGVINSQEVTTSDGKRGYKLNQPQNGIYILKVYSKTDISTLDQFLLSK